MKKHLPILIAGVSSVAVISVILLVSGTDAGETLTSFFIKPFRSAWNFGNLMDSMTLLLIAGAGSFLAMKGGTFNLGGEAQIYASALVSALLLCVPGPKAAVFALSLLAAAATGAFLGFIPGILKAYRKTNEMITSFLLSAALFPVLDFLIAGPLRDQTKNLLATREIPQSMRLTSLLPPSRMNLSFVITILLLITLTLFLRYTAAGIRLKITGIAEEFARFSGFPVKRQTIFALTASGAFHGLAGFFLIAGSAYMCHQGMSGGLGWSALAVALVARTNPLALIPSAFFFAWLQSASTQAILSSSFNFDPLSLVQAVLFFAVSARFAGIRGGKA